MHPNEGPHDDSLPPGEWTSPGTTGEPRAGYWCEVVSYLPDSGRSFWLAVSTVKSPRLALSWLTDRAERIAAQVDPTAAHAARAWIDDDRAHQRLLLTLTHGGMFTHTIADVGVRHLLSARPVHAFRPSWEGRRPVGWPRR